MQTDIKISPENLLEWGAMEDWVNGTSAAPTGHVLTGTGALIARESTIVKQGTYSAKMTRVGNDCILYEAITDYLSYLGRRMTFGRWVYATVASRAYISIYDGVNTNLSTAHTGSGTWEYLTVTADIAAAATSIRIQNHINTADTIAYFDAGIFCDGDIGLTDLSPYMEGWQWQSRYRIERYEVARRPGAEMPNMEFDDKAVNISMSTPPTSSVLTARGYVDTLNRALNPQRKRPDGKTLKHDLYLYDDRLLKVMPGSFDVDQAAALRVFKMKAKMQATEPFYRAVQKSRQSVSLSASPTTFTVAVVGTIYTFPILQFTPAGSNMTSCLLENLTTGENTSFGDTVNIADILKIDNDLQTVENDGVDSIGDFNGEFLKLVPGNNNFKFTGTTGGTLLIDWYEKYLFG